MANTTIWILKKLGPKYGFLIGYLIITILLLLLLLSYCSEVGYHQVAANYRIVWSRAGTSFGHAGCVTID